jgi:hypothetical protein
MLTPHVFDCNENVPGTLAVSDGDEILNEPEEGKSTSTHTKEKGKGKGKMKGKRSKSTSKGKVKNPKKITPRKII